MHPSPNPATMYTLTLPTVFIITIAVFGSQALALVHRAPFQFQNQVCEVGSGRPGAVYRCGTANWDLDSKPPGASMSPQHSPHTFAVCLYPLTQSRLRLGRAGQGDEVLLGLQGVHRPGRWGILPDVCRFQV